MLLSSSFWMRRDAGLDRGSFLPPPSMTVVLSLSTLIFFAGPSCSSVTGFELQAEVFEDRLAAGQDSAMSCSMALRRSP